MSFAKSLKDKSQKAWEDCYNHPFVQELGKGTLDKKTFEFYLKQDYKYLIEYARVYALGAAKADTEELMTKFTVVSHNILYNEMSLHRQYMREYGIDNLKAEDEKQSLFNKAYTSNMISVAQTMGTAEILAVVFPCAWSYADYALRLKETYKDGLEQNFYKSWIESYASEQYQNSFQWFFDTLDDLCRDKPDKELKRIEEIFNTSVEYEYLFWDMAYKQQMGY